MVLPLGDSPNPRGVPIVNYALIVANVAVYFLLSLPLTITPVDPGSSLLAEYLRVMPVDPLSPDAILERLSAYDLFIFEHGFRPTQPSFENLVASLFLHAGFFHLFGNMLILWIYGDNIEHRLGSIGYLFAYLVTGIAASVFHLALAPDSNLPLIGASGAISGILGLYFRWFPHNKVRLFVFLFPFLMDVFVVPARVVLGFYLVADNVLPLILRGASGGGIAYAAHIGGFLGGVVAAWLFDWRGVRRQPSDFRDVDAADIDASHLDEAVDQGRLEAAARSYFALPVSATKRALSPERGLRLAAWLRQTGHARAALTLYRRLIRDYPNDQGLAEAHLGAGLTLLEDLGEPTPAYQHLLDALDTNPSPAVAVTARATLQSILARDKFSMRRSPRSP